MMDLVHLRSFAHVAERGTVAAAATALDFSAPAVSQHIAKLEVELAAALFDRVGGRLRLTDAGRSLLPIALELLDLERRGRDATRQPPPNPRFVIAGFASALAALVVPKLHLLANRMTLEIMESEDTEAMRELGLGEVDVVLTQEYQGLASERDPRDHYTPLVTDRLRLVMPGTMADTTTVGELARSNWLMNGHDTRCAAATVQILKTAGLHPTIAATVADNETLLALVAADHGVTVVPELLLGPARADIVIGTQDLGVTRTIFAVNRATRNAAVAPLIEALLSSPGPAHD